MEGFPSDLDIIQDPQTKRHLFPYEPGPFIKIMLFEDPIQISSSRFSNLITFEYGGVIFAQY